MARDRQLFKLTGDGFQTFDRLGEDDTLIFKPADNVPMLFWPDGQWCLEANVFMQQLYTKGLSRRDLGGTLKTYAARLSLFIRYCAKNRTDFRSLSDNQFALFIKGLNGERDPITGTMVREPNATIAIGRICLEFLASVAELHQDIALIGTDGRVKAAKRSNQVGYSKRGKPIVVDFWHHNSFPLVSTYKKRLPIHTEAIKALKTAVLSTSIGNIYLRKRRYVMLRLFEITGARRLEIRELTVQSVIDASQMEVPALKLLTVKRSDEHYRMVPISRTDLDFLLEFIKINRARIIRKKGGNAVDDGFLLINEKTGKQIRSNTLTQEISLLAKTAKLTGQTCGHMFRHRFITKLFVTLIERHKLNNKDEFRQALLDESTFKRVVQEFTGHLSKESVDRYIELAFMEVGDFGKAYDAVKTKSAVDAAQSNIDRLDEELASGTISQSEHIEKMKFLVLALQKDLSGAVSTP